jgi:hypothetical protein
MHDSNDNVTLPTSTSIQWRRTHEDDDLMGRGSDCAGNPICVRHRAGKAHEFNAQSASNDESLNSNCNRDVVPRITK